MEFVHVRSFSEKDLEPLVEKAKTELRQRWGVPFSPREEPDVRPMINVMFPSTYVQPHRHKLKELWSFVAGTAYVIHFDNSGNITRAERATGEARSLVTNPIGVYHSIIIPRGQKYAAMQEYMMGPHDQENYKTVPEWAPAELIDRNTLNNPAALEYLAEMESKVASFLGEKNLRA